LKENNLRRINIMIKTNIFIGRNYVLAALRKIFIKDLFMI